MFVLHLATTGSVSEVKVFTYGSQLPVPSQTFKMDSYSKKRQLVPGKHTSLNPFLMIMCFGCFNAILPIPMCELSVILLSKHACLMICGYSSV